ncbi:monocarboxylate transporter 9-like isoform X2 [Mercenaria mercenaria]|uniref:monocarboxylate transporter 9-like isoform X2 n=1 Tax=Mercenaria mercenaria TaxID=6596 RepID=UPI001E1DDE14|nr:monocarboxylate transporter 9-like isoform X2 [Mercenaria mercenaria]
MMNTKSKEQRDGVRGWHKIFVLISCCLIMVLHLGLLHAIGILFTDIITTFNSTRAETAVIQSTSIGVSFISGIFTGALINKIGLMAVGISGSLLLNFALMVSFFATSLTYLIISVGVVGGLGFSCVYISSAAAISQHFSGRKQLLYFSVHATGAGIGGMLYPFLISDLYGFRGALLIIGAIGMNATPTCFLWKHHSNTTNPQKCVEVANQIEEFQTLLEVKTKDSGEIITIEKLKQTPPRDGFDSVYVSQYPVQQGETKTKTVIVEGTGNKSTDLKKSKQRQTISESFRRIWHIKSFIVFVLGSIGLTTSLALIIIFVADIYKDNGLTNDDVSLGLFLLNVMSTAGRSIPGMIIQSKRIPTLVMPLLNAVLSAVVIFSFIIVKSRWLLIVLSGVIGMPLGMCASMLTVVTQKLVGSDLLPIALGTFFTFNGICQVVAGPVNGYIRDVTGSYIAIFYIATGICLVGAVVFFLAHMTRRKKKHEIKRSSVL